MARYANKDFGLGKPNKKEKKDAQKMANMAKGKSPATPKSKLSAAMYTWADTNMSKLKNPTKKQQEIFRKYKSMKAAGDTPSNPKPRTAPGTPTGPKSPATRKTTKPAKVSQEKAASGSTGTTGSFRKSNPPSPTVERKPSKAGSRARKNNTDPRRRSVKRNLREAAAAKRRRERKEQFSKPYGGIASRPPANPKEGDTYKRPFGPVMIYKNGKFVRA